MQQYRNQNHAMILILEIAAGIVLGFVILAFWQQILALGAIAIGIAAGLAILAGFLTSGWEGIIAGLVLCGFIAGGLWLGGRREARRWARIEAQAAARAAAARVAAQHSRTPFEDIFDDRKRAVNSMRNLRRSDN